MCFSLDMSTRYIKLPRVSKGTVQGKRRHCNEKRSGRDAGKVPLDPQVFEAVDLERNDIVWRQSELSNKNSPKSSKLCHEADIFSICAVGCQ